jgi:ubiquinone/menaquinone biosynthesis C-methylase UbiE
MSTMSLHTLDPLTRFSDRASDYVKYRPSYPSEAIDAILAGLKSSLTVADVGAGTGISSRLLGDRGLRVVAIEPNQAMREAADPHPNVNYREGTAEQTGLPDQSVDLITCFQAFHWFEPESTLKEFHRVLKPSGRVALIWNTRDRSDDFTYDYSELLLQASNQHPAVDRLVVSQALFARSQFCNARELVFSSDQPLDLDGLWGATNSRSYIPRTGETNRRLLNNLESLYQRYADDSGFVYVKHKTQVIIAEV